MFFSVQFRRQAQLREGKARAAALLAGKAILRKKLGRLSAANTKLEGEKAALQAQADQEREAGQKERARLESEKAALQAALGAQAEAGRQVRAQHEAQLQERMARVIRAAMAPV